MSTNTRDLAHDLINGYQKSSYDSTWMPGIGDYMQQLIIQNEHIIKLLSSIDRSLMRIDHGQ